MTPVEPKLRADERLVLFAKNQPPYRPLLAAVLPGGGYVVTEWEPTAEELGRLVAGERVVLKQLTFGQALQPVSLSVGPR